MAIVTNRIEDDEMDMAEFFGVLWKRKWLVILGASICTVLAIAIVLLLPRTYRADGFLQMTAKEKFSIPAYKAYSPAIANCSRFLEFVREKNLITGGEFRRLEKKLKEPDDLNRLMTPVYAYTKEDTRDLGRLSKEDFNYLLGLGIEYEGSSPKAAVRFIKVLAAYIRDAILRGRINEFVFSKFDEAQDESLKNENLIYSGNFDMRQLEKKRDEFKAILKKYPESGRSEIRQVISVENTGYRYLSPATQLVGIESNISDIREKIAGFTRNKEKAAIDLEFFSRMKEVVGQYKWGDQYLEEIQALKNRFFQEQRSGGEMNREVFNEITATLSALTGHFTEGAGIGLAGEPESLRDPVGPKRKVIVLVTFVVSFLLFVLAAFTIDWWEKNRERILKKG